MNFRTHKPASGFTLLEVMIALTIFAAIALAISQTASQRVDTLLYLHDKTLAAMLAENKINEQRLKGLPRVGSSNAQAVFANRDWHVFTEVEKTEFPDTVRVTVNVAALEHKDSYLASLVTIMGKY